MKFNIFGFKTASEWHTTKHCIIHPGTRLQPKRDGKGDYEPGILQCPQCGTIYSEKDTIAEERFIPKSNPRTKPQIILAKNKNKKHYDKAGNEINDETLLQDIANGSHVIYYNEVKLGEDRI